MADFIESVLKAIGVVIKFIFDLLINLICLFLFFFSLAAVWRWPFLGEMWEDAKRSNSDPKSYAGFRSFCGLSFLAAMFDFVTAPAFFITLLSWRMAYLIWGIKYLVSTESKPYNIKARLFVWSTLGRLVADTIAGFAFFLQLIVFWRIPMLFRAIHAEVSVEGTELAPSSLKLYGSNERTPDNTDNCDSRTVIFGCFAAAAADFVVTLITTPFIIFSLCTWRCATFLHEWRFQANKEILYKGGSHGFIWCLNARGRFYSLWVIFVLVPTDIFTFMAFLLAHIPFWRVHILYRTVGEFLRQHGDPMIPSSVISKNRIDSSGYSVWPRSFQEANSNKFTSSCSEEVLEQLSTSEWVGHADGPSHGTDLKIMIIAFGFLQTWWYMLVDLLCLPFYIFSLLALWRTGSFIARATEQYQLHRQSIIAQKKAQYAVEVRQTGDGKSMTQAQIDQTFNEDEFISAIEFEDFCYGIRKAALITACKEVAFDVLCFPAFIFSLCSHRCLRFCTESSLILEAFNAKNDLEKEKPDINTRKIKYYCSDIRFLALRVAFLEVPFDILCLPAFLLCTFSWRCLHFWHQASYDLALLEVNYRKDLLQHKHQRSAQQPARTYYCMELRFTALRIAFVELPLDLCCIVLFLLSHVVIWRMPKMYMYLYDHVSKYGSAILPKSLLPSSSSNNNNDSSSSLSAAARLIHLFPPLPNPTVNSEADMNRVVKVPRLRDITSNNNNNNNNNNNTDNNNLENNTDGSDEIDGCEYARCFFCGEDDQSVNCDCDGAKEPTDATRQLIFYEIFLKGWTQLVVDLATMIPFILTLLSWRCFALVKSISLAVDYDNALNEVEEKEKEQSKGNASGNERFFIPQNFSWKARKNVWYQFGKYLIDIPHVLFLILGALLAPWRLGKFYSAISEMYDCHGFPLLPWTQDEIRELEVSEVTHQTALNQKQSAATTVPASSSSNDNNHNNNNKISNDDEAREMRLKILLARENYDLDLNEEYRLAIRHNCLASLVELITVIITMIPTALVCAAPWRYFYFAHGVGCCFGAEVHPAAVKEEEVKNIDDDGENTTNQDDTKTNKNNTNDDDDFQPKELQTVRNQTSIVLVDSDTFGTAANNNNNDVINNKNHTNQQTSSNPLARSPGNSFANTTTTNAPAAAATAAASSSSLTDQTTTDTHHTDGKRKRVLKSLSKMRKKLSGKVQTLRADKIDGSKFFVFWMTGFQVLLDFLSFITFILAHLSLIRIYFLYGKIAKEFRANGCTLLPWTLNPSPDENNHNNSTITTPPLRRQWNPTFNQTKYRSIFLNQALHSLAEIILLPFIIILGLTWYRGNRVIDFTNQMEADEDEQEKEDANNDKMKKNNNKKNVRSSTAAEQQQRKTAFDQKLFILKETVYLFIDFITAIFSLIVLCSGFRTITFINDVRRECFVSSPTTTNNSSPSSSEQQQEEKKKNNNKSNNNVVAIDDEPLNMKWIELTFTHFIFIFFDILCFPFAVLVLCTLYRGYMLIAEVKRRVAKWASIEKSAIKVQQIFFEPPPNARQTGFVLRIKGTKDSDFVVPRDKADTISIFVRGDQNFWKNIGSAFGAVAATMGQNLLPLVVKKEYFNPSEQIRAGDTEVDLVMDFNISAKTSTIRKKLAICPSHTNCIIQVEFGSSHDGTLFGAKFPLADGARALDGTTPAVSSMNNNISLPHSNNNNNNNNNNTKNHELPIDSSFSLEKYFSSKECQGERFTDVWWRVAFIQLGLFLLDLITLMGFLLLHLFPYRVFALYSQVCESREQKNNRQFKANVVDELEDSIVNQFPKSVNELLDKFSTCTKLHPGRQAFQGELTDWYNTWKRRLISNTTLKNALEQRILAMEAASSLSSVAPDSSQNNNNNKKEEDPVSKNIETILKEHLDFVCQMTNEIQVSMKDKFPLSSDPDENTSTTPGLLSFAKSLIAQDAVGNNNINSNNKTSNAYQSSASFFKTNPSFTNFELDIQKPSVITQKAQELSTRSNQVLDSIIKPTLSSSGGCCQIGKNTEGMDGFRVDLKNIWIEALLDIPAMIVFAFIIGTFYRLPWTIWKIFQNRREPRRVTYFAFCEIWADLFYLILFCVSCIGIRAIYRVPYELATNLYYWPSFNLARLIVIHNWSKIGRDLVKIFKIFLNCTAVKFLLASVFFGALSPGVLIEGSLVQEEEDSNVCRAGLVLLFGLFWMFGLPFVLTTDSVTESSEALLPGIIFFSMFVGYYVISILVCLCRKSEKVFKLRRLIVRHARPNWHNLSTFGWMFLELVQLLALSIGSLAISRNIQFGNSADTTESVLEASRYVFLLFLRPGSNSTRFVQEEGFEPGDPLINKTVVDYTPPRVPAGAPVSLTVMVCYFLLSTIPIVCVYILKISEAKKLRVSTGYGSAMKFLGFALQLTVVRNIAEVLSCGLNSATNNNEMRIQPGLICYGDDEGNEHSTYAVVMMLFGVYYLISTLCHNIIYDEADAARSDIITAGFYRIIVSGPFVAATVIVAFSGVGNNNSSTEIPSALFVLLAASVWGLFWSIFYGKLLNSEENAFCTLRLVELLRIALYSSSLVCSAICIAAAAIASGDDDILWVVWASIGVSLFFFAVAYILAEKYCCGSSAAACVVGGHEYPEEDSLDEVRQELITLESRLVSEDRMTPVWVEMRRAWLRKVETALRPSTLAAAAVHLETGIISSHLDNFYLNSRSAWKTKTEKLIDETEKDETGISTKDSRMARQLKSMAGDGASSDYDSSLACCCCGRYCNVGACCYFTAMACCQCDRSSWSSDSSHDNENIRNALSQQTITLLSQVVQTLRNGLIDTKNKDNNNNVEDVHQFGSSSGGGAGTQPDTRRLYHNTLQTLYKSNNINIDSDNNTNNDDDKDTATNAPYPPSADEELAHQFPYQFSSMGGTSSGDTMTTMTNTNSSSSKSKIMTGANAGACGDNSTNNTSNSTNNKNSMVQGETNKNENVSPGGKNNNNDEESDDEDLKGRVHENFIKRVLKKTLTKLYQELEPSEEKTKEEQIDKLVETYAYEADRGFPGLLSIIDFDFDQKGLDRFEALYADYSFVQPGGRVPSN